MSTVANKANFVDIEFISASIKIFLPESGEKCHVSYRGMTLLSDYTHVNCHITQMYIYNVRLHRCQLSHNIYIYCQTTHMLTVTQHRYILSDYTHVNCHTTQIYTVRLHRC